MQTNTKHYQLIASEFEWSISENKQIKAKGFNQSVPGPVIRAKKGDTVIVTVKNELDEPTMIHWHGIQLPADMDGTSLVQKPIQPGESFESRFEVPDAGTFWYHSHKNETEQMEQGMYGALIVEDTIVVPTDGERIFMIDDMKLTADNAFTKGGFISRWKERHDGREGETLLVNGKENTVIQMHAGQTERWRFINASSARYIRLSFEGRSFKILSTDGGFLETPREATEILMTPGERFDILAGPFGEDERFAIESLPYDRMTFVKTKRREYATVEVLGTRPSVATIPAAFEIIEPLAPQHAVATRKVRFSVGASLKRGIDFLVNGEMHTHDEPVRKGELQVWEISNTSLMDHPFHLHGFFFQVLEVNGKAPEYVSWKDTYNLAPRSTIKIAWMPDRVGSWMYHCHILEHHEAGMMAHFEVVEHESEMKHVAMSGCAN